MPAKQTPESFWKKVDIKAPTECWPWVRSKKRGGYGQVSWGDKSYTAHRVAAYLSGIVPTLRAPADRKAHGVVLHSCDNPSCCNPAHLRAGTPKENAGDCTARRRWAAVKGSAHHNAKLTQEKATAIREIYAAGGVSYAELGRRYGVKMETIYHVINNKTWKETT